MKRVFALLLGLSILTAPAHAGMICDKVDDRIAVGTSDTLMPNGSAWTLYARTKPGSEGENNDGRVMARLSTTGVIWGLTPTAKHNLYSTWSGTDVFRNGADSTITFGAWASEAVSYDGTATAASAIIHYSQGVEISEGVGQNGTGSAESNSGQTTYLCGDSGTANTFDGPFGEAADWGTATLTAQEHLNLAKSGVKRMALQIQPSNLKAYWPLDECADGATCSTANMFTDMSGNGNHGSPSGNPVGAAEATMSYP